MNAPGSMDGPTAAEGRPMVFPKARAAVGAVLFLAWLVFLAYLAFDRIEPTILARPQILTANLLVIADLEDSEGRPSPRIRVQKLLATEKDSWRNIAGSSLDLDDLPFHSALQGWQGAGSYLVPITRTEKGKVTLDQVTPLPIVPGYFAPASEVTVNIGKQPDAMVKLIAHWTGVPLARLREMAAQPVVVLTNVPVRSPADSRDLREQVEAAGGSVERLRPAESRIYQATPDVLAQLRMVRTDVAP